IKLLILLGSFVFLTGTGEKDGIFRRFATRPMPYPPVLTVNSEQGTATLTTEHLPAPYIRLSKCGAVH
ncbi:hypothetical protein, partial [Agrobacterium sp. TS43]|uniref:hypothetical protein n=1 Tax=Agrobacterium sp. TS43 TaxID=477196 RepID=UPI001AECAF74